MDWMLKLIPLAESFKIFLTRSEDHTLSIYVLAREKFEFGVASERSGVFNFF